MSSYGRRHVNDYLVPEVIGVVQPHLFTDIREVLEEHDETGARVVWPAKPSNLDHPEVQLPLLEVFESTAALIMSFEICGALSIRADIRPALPGLSQREKVDYFHTDHTGFMYTAADALPTEYEALHRLGSSAAYREHIAPLTDERNAETHRPSLVQD